MDGQTRREWLEALYALLARQADEVGGPRRLGASSARDGWPSHGVYVFFEPGELREDGITPRVVRVGTHALTEDSKTTLWGRLRTHRGNVGGRNPGGGNHRGSVFRLHAGNALLARDGDSEAAETWGRGSQATTDVRARERRLERAVSSYLGAMDLLWLDVPDHEARGLIERGLIALLSNANHSSIDPPSEGWLGHHSPHPAIRSSGLWNVNHVHEQPTIDVLDHVKQAAGG